MVGRSDQDERPLTAAAGRRERPAAHLPDEVVGDSSREKVLLGRPPAAVDVVLRRAVDPAHIEGRTGERRGGGTQCMEAGELHTVPLSF